MRVPREAAPPESVPAVPPEKTLASFERGTPTDEVLAALRRDGAVVVERQVDTELADTVLR